MHYQAMLAMFAQGDGHMPSIGSMLIFLLVLGSLLFLGTRLASGSRRRTRPGERILTNKVDDNGVPLFFDLDTHDSQETATAHAPASSGSHSRSR